VDELPRGLLTQDLFATVRAVAKLAYEGVEFFSPYFDWTPACACLHAKADPVAFIQANPGRISSVHCKDWSPDPDKGYRVLFGEGAAHWKKIFQVAEQVGGVEHYLIEQEGSLPLLWRPSLYIRRNAP